MVKDRRPSSRDRNTGLQNSVVHVRLYEDDRSLLGILADHQGCSMAEYLRHAMRICARTAIIVQTARQAEARREADEARQVEERERRELEEYLATPEGHTALAEAKQRQLEETVREMYALMHQEHEKYDRAKAMGRLPDNDDFP